MSARTLLVAVRDTLWAVEDAGAAGRGVSRNVAAGEYRRMEPLFRPGSRLQCVAVDPGKMSQIFCGTSTEGLWRSRDRGRSWERVGEGVVRPRVTAVAVAPSVWMGGAGEDMGAAGVVSDEGVASGAGVASDEGAARDSVAADVVVYAGTEPSRLYRSTNGGASWVECRSLAALPSAPTWSFPPRPETSHIRWISPDPRVPGRLYVAVEAGALVMSADGGETWTDRRPGGPYDTHTLVVHPRAEDRLYSAAGDGYFESHDGGASWVRREEGLEHRYVWGLTVHLLDPESVLISAARSAGAAHNATRAESWLYRRTSNSPWHAVRRGLPEPTGTTISVLARDPIEPGTVYAANNRGVYHSEDGGESWAPLDLDWPEEYEDERVAGLVILAE